MASLFRYGQRLPFTLPVSLLNASCAASLVTASAPACWYATAARPGSTEEELHQLRWPPSSEALAANPALAHVVRAAAKHARSELPSRLQQLLKRSRATALSRQDLEQLKDFDVIHELQLLGEQTAGPRSQLLDGLYMILQKQQPAAARNAIPARQPQEPAERDALATVRTQAPEQVAADTATTDEDQLEFARVASPMEVAEMLMAAKADDVVVLDVADLCNFTEHMVLATGRSHRHIQAAAQAVAHQISLRCTEVAPGIKPSVEGQDGADWCVVDAGSVIVHVFSSDARSLYDLDSLWRSGDNITRVEPAYQTAHTLQTLNVDSPPRLAHS